MVSYHATQKIMIYECIIKAFHTKKPVDQTFFGQI